MPKNDRKKLSSPAGTPFADFKKLYITTKQATDKIFIQIPSITLPEGACGISGDCFCTCSLLSGGIHPAFNKTVPEKF